VRLVPSIVDSASSAESGSRRSTRRAPVASTPITLTWWATTSCSSRAIRRRSSATAWAASASWLASAVRARSSSARVEARRLFTERPTKNATAARRALFSTSSAGDRPGSVAKRPATMPMASTGTQSATAAASATRRVDRAANV
jgi:hypothetical protein